MPFVLSFRLLIPQSWYTYYIGNSGLGPFNFAISAWQNLLFLAGWDPAFPGRNTPCGAGGERSHTYSHSRDLTRIQTVISWRTARNDQVCCRRTKKGLALRLPSQLDRLDYKRIVLCFPGSDLFARRIFRRLRNMEAAHYDSLHIDRMGCQLWMARSHEPRQVSLLHCYSLRPYAYVRWQVGTGLYIVGLISYQGALTCW